MPLTVGHRCLDCDYSIHTTQCLYWVFFYCFGLLKWKQPRLLRGPPTNKWSSVSGDVLIHAQMMKYWIFNIIVWICLSDNNITYLHTYLLTYSQSLRYRESHSLFRWTGDSSTKDDMIIMENLIPRGFLVLQHGDPKERRQAMCVYCTISLKRCNFVVNQFQ